MTYIQEFISDFSIILLIMVIVIRFSLLNNFSLKKSIIVAVSFIGILFVKLNDTFILYFLKSLIGDLSITSIVLIAISLFSLIFKIDLFYKNEKKFLSFIFTLTGIIFYTLALGVTYVDPYFYGYFPKNFMIILTLFFIALFLWRFYIISACIFFAVIAHFFKILNSENLWDYIIDPYLTFYSIFSLIIPFIPYKKVKFFLKILMQFILKGLTFIMRIIKKLTVITNKFPKLLQFIFYSTFVFVLFFSIMRIAFHKFFYDQGGLISDSVILNAFYIGLKFDLRLALLIHLPLLIFFKIKSLSLFNSSNTSRFWINFLVVIFALLFFMYISDFGYYGYLQTGRLDATALSFLLNPLISLQMVWESYPVIPFILLYIFAVATFRWILHKIHFFVDKRHEIVFTSNKKYFSIIVFLVLFVAGIYGKYSYYPLRWSDAFFSNHFYASVLSFNPILYFFETLKNREIQYDIEKVKKYKEPVSEFLGIKSLSNSDNNLFLREEIFVEQSNIDFNLVFILLESFAYYKTGMSGNPLNPTPNFDKLAKDGIFFKNSYCSHGGTARAVFTVLTGIPDVEAIKTSSRNPLVVNQRTIINAFKDHEKFYFLGGSANWGNIKGLLKNNIPNLKLYEEGAFTSPRGDVWGISDLHLFEETNFILREEKKPFVAVIHTAGNHKPYTIPDDNRGFNPVTPTLNVEDYGFRSVDDYNAFRFMDHSMGLFFEKVKNEKYFENTIFVLFADHGLLRKANHMSKAENELGLTDFHTSYLIYSPKFIKDGKIIEKIVSHVDILPTVASLTKTPYINSTFGRNILDSSFDDKAYAFTITHYGVHEIGLLSKDFYFRVNADGTRKNLYLLNSENPSENVFEKFIDTGKKMEDLCFGIYESARYIRYNNKNDNAERKNQIVS